MRMHIVLTLWEVSAVNVIQDILEMDKTAQVNIHIISSPCTTLPSFVVLCVNFTGIYHVDSLCMDGADTPSLSNGSVFLNAAAISPFSRYITWPTSVSIHDKTL